MCNVNAGKEWIDDLLATDKNHPKDPLYEMVETSDLDLILTFASGGYNIIHPNSGTNVENQLFANLSTIIDDEPPVRSCDAPDQSLVIQQKQQSLTDRLYRDYKVPMFALQLGCCGMPPIADIATVWRSNIKNILNFVFLLSSGVEGQVQDVNGIAIRDAQVSVDSSSFAAVTKNLAHFKIVLSPNEHTIVVRAAGYKDYESKFRVSKNSINSLGVIVLYANDEKREHHQYHTTEAAMRISGKF